VLECSFSQWIGYLLVFSMWMRTLWSRSRRKTTLTSCSLNSRSCSCRASTASCAAQPLRIVMPSNKSVVAGVKCFPSIFQVRWAVPFMLLHSLPSCCCFYLLFMYVKPHTSFDINYAPEHSLHIVSLWLLCSVFKISFPTIHEIFGNFFLQPCSKFSFVFC